VHGGGFSTVETDEFDLSLSAETEGT